MKMIYINPLYNAGNDFIYRDDFKQSAADYDEDSGVYDEDGTVCSRIRIPMDAFIPIGAA